MEIYMNPVITTDKVLTAASKKGVVNGLYPKDIILELKEKGYKITEDDEVVILLEYNRQVMKKAIASLNSAKSETKKLKV